MKKSLLDIFSCLLIVCTSEKKIQAYNFVNVINMKTFHQIVYACAAVISMQYKPTIAFNLYIVYGEQIVLTVTGISYFFTTIADVEAMQIYVSWGTSSYKIQHVYIIKYEKSLYIMLENK